MRSLFNGERPKLIMFDLDGTLVDSVPDLAAAVDSAFVSQGLSEVGEANVRLWVGDGAESLIRRALSYVLDDVEDVFFENVFSEFLLSYGGKVADKSKLYPGVKETLDVLYELSIPMAIVTNKPIAFTRTLLSSLNIDHFFSYVLGGDSLAKKKPDPLPLQTLMSKYGLFPSQVLMVGDSVNDILSARSAGCAVVAVSYGYNHGNDIYEAGADLVVTTLVDLL